MTIFNKLSLFLVLLHAPLVASIVDHLKKYGEKGEGHSYPGIDCIYMIASDQRAGKELASWGICPYRVSAVQGEELSLAMVNDIGVKFRQGMREGDVGTSYLTQDLEPSHSIVGTVGQVYFAHGMTRNMLGISLSHLSILKDALDAGFKTIWVMEEEIEVVGNPTILPLLIKGLNRLDPLWEILFTDRNAVKLEESARRPDVPLTTRLQDQRRSKDFIKIGGRSGSYSMILRRAGMEKIFAFLTSHHLYLPYDRDASLTPGIRMYTVGKNIVTKALSNPSCN